MVEPYLTQDMIKRLAKLKPAQRALAMKAIGKEEFDRCAADIFYWIDSSRHPIPYVYTKDPKPMHVCNLCNDGETYSFDKRDYHLLSRHKIESHTEATTKQYFAELDTIRKFPMKSYFVPIIEHWMKHPLMAVEKSRDMMGTWLMVAMYTWDTCFHRGRQNLFQSEDAGKTRELVRRAYGIWNNQPDWLKAVAPATFAEGSYRSGILAVTSLQSEILGLPKGTSKVRMHHPTGFFSDEAAFNPDAAESFAAIKPAISDGGKYSAISSANPGWFHRLCRDALEA